jgi:ribosomal protein S18 acetylase RimI-like enzyme
MRDREYSDYLEYFIPDYAAEISANYGLSSLEALAQARREVADDLPLGVDTPDEVMRCVINQTSETESVVDFYIFAAHQGKGFGKQALKALETELARTGFEQIKLRVAEDNKRAKHVYDITGFRVTGVNMSKIIKTE